MSWTPHIFGIAKRMGEWYVKNMEIFYLRNTCFKIKTKEVTVSFGTFGCLVN